MNGNDRLGPVRSAFRVRNSAAWRVGDWDKAGFEDAGAFFRSYPSDAEL